jgi:hypothetical protein
MEDEQNNRIGRSVDFDARLPIVVCNPDLSALKEVGLQLECDLFDMLFAVFGLAVRDGVASDFRPHALWSPEASRPEEEGRDKIGYVISLPRRIWSSDVARGSVSDTGILPATGDGSVAFIRTCRRKASSDLRIRARRRENRCLAFYNTLDLVAEVTESERHVLIECFFRSKIVSRNTVARLLFRYLETVKDVGELRVDSRGIGRRQ